MKDGARTDADPLVGGSVAAAFEEVREQFAREAADSRGGSGFCAYVDGVPVVDLWAGEARPGVAWSHDTLSVLFSCTKALTALCLQVLADRGLLEVDAPVARYWPEFAQAGKERVLVRHVLDHTSGVLGLPDAAGLLDWDGGGWDDYDAIAARLAAAAPAWEPGTQAAYHAVTSGWLSGELVRRVDGRTLGAFFREEIAEPLELDLWIGTPARQRERLALLHGFPDAAPSEDEAYMLEVEREHLERPDTLLAQSLIHMHGATIVADPVAFFGNPRVQAVEIPASNGSGTAHGLARMHALLAMGGELDGVRLVSAASVARFGAVSSSSPSAIWPWRELRLPSGRVARAPITRWALGYALDSPSPEDMQILGPVEEAFGAGGLGGQLGFCDPVGRVAVGYLRSDLRRDFAAAGRIVEALYACLDAA